MSSSSDGRQPGQRKDYHVKLFKTPKETLVGVSVAASKKAELRLDLLVLLSCLAGVWISLGGFVSLIFAGGMPSIEPGLRKLVAGTTFSVGLMLVVSLGSELFTGNVVCHTIGILTRRVSILALARSWIVSWIFNFVGSIATAYLLAYLTDLVAVDPYLSYLRTITVAKIEGTNWGIMVLRGIGANILVCMALLVALASEDILSKFFGILFFITTFVIIGFEHSVANMFVLPLGLMYGAQSSVGAMLWKNIVPVTLGNIIGGVFVGLSHWWVYLYAIAPPVKRESTWWKRTLYGEGESASESDSITMTQAWADSGIQLSRKLA